MEPQSPVRGRAIALLATGLLALSPGARAHIVYGATTLHQLVAGADAVARARILETDALVAAPTASGRPVVEARVLEVLKGDIAVGAVRFVQHGHGVAEFHAGDEVLLFLRELERSRELDELAGVEGLRFVSLQEHGEEFVITPSSRAVLLGAVRDHVGLESASTPEARLEALQRITVSHLASGEPRVAASALNDLVILEQVPLVGPADLPTLDAVLMDEKVSIGVRLGLLAVLERRGVVAGPERWIAILDASRGVDRVAAVRAAGMHPSPSISARLVEILGGEDAAAAEAAAVALGSPGNDAAVAPLARTLGGGDSRLRMAAIRGLGRIGTPAARRALVAASSSHADPTTRRRAGAEVELLGRGAPAPRSDPATSAVDH